MSVFRAYSPKRAEKTERFPRSEFIYLRRAEYVGGIFNPRRPEKSVSLSKSLYS